MNRNTSEIQSDRHGESTSMHDLYRQWSDTLQSVGIKPLSDDTCCKLLAITYIFAGGRSEFVLNHKLQTDICYAQKRLRILGGEIPDPELTSTLRHYICELAPCGIVGEWLKPEWAIELMSRYDLAL